VTTGGKKEKQHFNLLVNDRRLIAYRIDQKSLATAKNDEMRGTNQLVPVIISSYVCFSSGASYAYAWPFYVFFSFFRLA